MKKVLSRAGRIITSLLVIAVMELLPLPTIWGTAHAASATLTINGSQKYQTMDGFGTNINSGSWKNGELKPALDKLTDSGVTLWRVVVENTDWEATNDDSDPNNYNWAYYNTIYSSQKFQDLWNTIAYLNSKGFSNNIIVNFMGPGPAWMGRDVLTTTDQMKNEWVEMASSVAYYARNTAHVQFGLFAPGNEPDLDCASAHEGICMDPSTYADVMTRLAGRLDSIGLSDLRFIGPDTGFINRGVGEYLPAMTAKPALMAKLAHFGFHNYSGDTGYADATIKASAYPTKNFWMDEVSQFNDAMPFIDQNAAGVLTWEGFDSVYNHPQLRGEPAIAPNDPGDAPALLAYDSTTGVYTPRKEYYQFKQLFKYIPGGSVRVNASNSASGVTTYAFVDPASGRVTIVGNNTSSSTVTFNASMSGISTAVPAFEYYTTDAGSANFQRGADVPVSSNSFTVAVPANGIFTLTYAGAPDTTAPTVALTTPATNATLYGSANLQATASDNIGVSKVTFVLDGSTVLATVAAAPYQYTWNLAGVAPGSHTISAVAYDSANNTATSTSTVTVVADTTAPNVPTGLAGTSSTGNRVDLSWNASTDDSGTAVTYTIKRNGSVMGTSATTTYSDTNVNAGTTYNYTVAASDASGNISADSAAVPVTTASAAPLSAGTPVITHQTSVGSSITSGTFTAKAGDLVMAFLTSDGPSASAQSFNTPTTTGLTWTLRKRANATGSGTAEIWSAVVPSGFTNGTVSATRASGLYQGSITIVAFSNADTSTAMATGSASGTNVAPSLSLTTTRTGSFVWATGDDWTNVASRTAGPGQTIVDQYLPSGIGAYWVQKQTNPTTTPGTTTVSDTAPSTSNKWNMAAVEILPILPPPSDTQTPTVSLTAPTAGATISGTQTLSATATDNVGVTKVEFYDNGVLLATDTTAPYTYNWDSKTASNGSHTLTAKAYDAAGNTTTSAGVSVNVFNDTAAPSVPGNVQALALDENKVAVSWNDSTDNVGVAGYDLYRATGAGSFTKITTITGTTSFTDTGRTASATYRYYVQAFDATGNYSAASTPVTVTMPDLTAPAFPAGANVTAQAQSSTQALVSWPATAIDNVGVTGYVVSHALASDTTNLTVVATVSSTTTNVTDSGLAAGQAYFYQVQAIDAAGNLSTPLQTTVQLPVPDTSAPDAPGNARLSTATATSLTLSWDKPADNVGVTGYQIWRSDITDHALATITNGNTLTFTDTNLVPQTNYSYTILAVDAAGNTSAPTALDATTLADLQAPTAPSNLAAPTTTLTSVTLQWTGSTDNVGVTGYEVYRSTTPDGGFNLVISLQPNATTLTDAGLQSGTNYYYFVRALDANGNLADSVVLQTATQTPDTTPPTVPTLTTSAASFARTHLSWMAATDASGIGGYTVQRGSQTIATLGAGVTSYDDNALTAGQSYTYTVVATDTKGNASQSSSSVTLPVPAITAPTTGSSVTGSVTITANTLTGVAGVQFLVDGTTTGSEDTTAPYSVSWSSTSVANGSHSLGATFRDSWGNTATAAPVGVTVTNPTSTLAIDVNVSVDPTTNGSTIVSPTFSTNSTNELLVVLVEVSGPNTSGGQSVKSLTGGSLTWTLRSRANTRYGTAEVWTAPASAKLKNVSVTATKTATGYIGSMTVLGFTGADLTTIGATNKASATTGLPSVNVTATRVGSIVLGSGNDWDGASARTVGSGQTLIHQYVQTTTGDTFWSQKADPSTAVGQSITLNNVAPTPATHQWNLTAVEILPAP